MDHEQTSELEEFFEGHPARGKIKLDKLEGRAIPSGLKALFVLMLVILVLSVLVLLYHIFVEPVGAWIFETNTPHYDPYYDPYGW